MPVATGALKGATAIVGNATVVTRRGDRPRRTALELQATAARLAMEDAGITRREVGVLFTARSPTSYFTRQFNMRLLNELKVAPAYTSEITSHGAGAVGMLQLASVLLATGMVDYALCTCGDGDASWLGEGGEAGPSTEADPQFEAPYAPTGVSLYGQVARRYMHETGATSEQFARAVVESRKWGLRHPDAVTRDKGEITVEDVLASRMVASPLRALDCAPAYPGAIVTAVVLTRADLAQRRRPDPIYLLGFGQCNTHEFLTDRLGLWGIDPAADGPNITRTGARRAAAAAFEMAGLEPKDIDFAESSANFSFLIPLMIEELGFCAPGEGPRFVESGGIDFDGGLPFNTNGGYLSYGQRAQGNYLLQEAIEQLRGQARGRQVAGAARALVHGHGGVAACHAVLIIGRSPK